MPAPTKESQQARLFGQGPASLPRLLLLLVCAIALMAADLNYGWSAQARRAGQWLLTPVRIAASAPADITNFLINEWAIRSRLREENTRLRELQLRNAALLQRSEVLAEQNERLRALLKSSKSVPDVHMVAELRAVDLDPFRHRVLIDKGSQHGVAVGEALIDENGIMGQVTEVAPLSSFAMLISDPDHALPVRMNRTGLRGVAYGTGSLDALTVSNISISADVEVGDLVVSSGLAGRFPEGYPVGRVATVEKIDDGSFLQALVKPLAALERAQYVLLLQAREPLQRPGETESGGPS